MSQPIQFPLKLFIPQGVEVVTTTNIEEGVGADLEEASIPDKVVTRTKIKMRIVFQL